jgi:predicted branched-subunit amino acid permease
MGLALGVALGALSTEPVVAWLGAPLLIAGSSQLVLMTQLDAGTTVLAAIGAALLVNSRFVVYGAALAERFAGQPAWFRWLGPHFIVDQTYGMVTARGTGPRAVDDDPAAFRRYFLTASILLWLLWTASVGLGVTSGPVLPDVSALGFVLPAMFVALVVPGLRTRREVAVALVGASIAATGMSPLLAIAGAVAAGVALGARPEEAT